MSSSTMANKRALIVAPDSRIVKKSRNNAVVEYAGKQQVQTITRSSTLAAPTLKLTGHGDHVTSIEYSRDGLWLISGSFDKSILLWRGGGNCENLKQLHGHQAAILDLSWSKDGLRIYSCGADQLGIVWDVETGTRVKRLRGYESFVNSCSANGDHSVATGGENGQIMIWDDRQRRPAQTISSPNDLPVTAVALSEDGRAVFSGGIDPCIYAWDLRQASSSVPVLSLRGHVDTITGLSLRPNGGTHLLSNGMDNTLRSWDVQPFCQNPSRAEQVFYGSIHDQEQTLLRCAWNGDASYVSCGSADRMVRIWDYDTARIVYCLPGHEGSVNSTSFAPGQQVIASASHDSSIYVGELN